MTDQVPLFVTPKEVIADQLYLNLVHELENPVFQPR